MIETLRDGSRVEIRPIEPDDRDALAAGFERLSPEARYRRFFGTMPELPERMLDYLTRVDHHHHEALIAVDPENGDGVGVARFVRTGPEAAEPAIVVVDDWQGRGLASRLLDELADRARAEGIRRFDAPVLAENQEAITVLERLGTTRLRRAGREVELAIELPPARGVGLPLRSLLKEVAAGSVEPARTIVEWLWPRRSGGPDDERRNVIVVGTDGSGHAEAAVETAGDLAAASGATIELVGAHRLLPPEQAGVARAVRDAAGALSDRGVHVHDRTRRGDPALVLTDVAEECNARLIVVGAGDRGVAARLIGSTADLVAQRSPCDVLIVRPGRAGSDP